MPREQPRTTPVEVTQEEAIVALYWMGDYDSTEAHGRLQVTMWDAKLLSIEAFWAVTNSLAAKLAAVARPQEVTGIDPRD